MNLIRRIKYRVPLFSHFDSLQIVPLSPNHIKAALFDKIGLFYSRMVMNGFVALSGLLGS